MTEKGLLEEFTEKDFEKLDITDSIPRLCGIWSYAGNDRFEFD